MSRNNNDWIKRGVQQSKSPFDQLTDIQYELQNIQQGQRQEQQEQQEQQQQQESTSGGSTLSTSDTQQSINRRGRLFEPPFGLYPPRFLTGRQPLLRQRENAPFRATSSTNFENNLDPTSNRGLFLRGRYQIIPDYFATTSSTRGANDLALPNGPDQNNVEPLGGNLVTSYIPPENAPFRATSSTSIGNQQGGNYLYPGSNRGRSLRQPGSTSFGSTSSTSVDNRQEPYDYFNDPTKTEEVRIINREVRDISQAHAREVNPNLDLEKWRKDYEARMRRQSLNRRNRRLENAPNNRPRALTSSTSSANDSALRNDPDQNNFEPLGRNSVTSNIPIGGPVPPRMSEPATRGKKRERQQQQEQEQPYRKKRG